MTKVITSVNALLAPEGERIAYTYSEIEDDGTIVSRRNKGYFMATTDEEKAAVETLKASSLARLK